MENRDVLGEKKFPDYSKVKDKLRVRLVRKEGNQKFYKQGPYIQHPIGVEVLYVELTDRGKDAVSVHVTNEIAYGWGTPIPELFETALENTQSKESVQILSMNELVGLPRDMRPGALEIYTLTNETYKFGATVLLYPDVLKEIYERLGMDFYVFPSSLHEVMIFPKVIEMDGKGLSQLVRDISFSEVELDDVLGYEAYEYWGKTGKLKQCSKSGQER